MMVPLRRPSADTAVIVGAVLAGLKVIYRPGYQYAKAGVMLLEMSVFWHLQLPCTSGFYCKRSFDYALPREG